MSRRLLNRHAARRRPMISLVALAFALTSAATPAQTKPKADITVVADADGVHAGATSRVAVRASLPPGVHVQSNAPRDLFLIATAVTVAPTPGVSVVETVYPPATDFTQVGQALPLAVFEQQFVIGLKLAIARGTAVGELSVPIRVRYQACNATTCFAPTTEDLRLPLRVVPESAKTTAQLKGVFDALRFRR